MKTCPNCGSKMEADVNFCTVCGTNIKDVPLDGAQPVEQLAPQAPVNPQPQPVQQPNSQPTQPVQNQEQNLQNTARTQNIQQSNINNVQPNQQQSTQQSVQNTQPSQASQVASETFSKVSSAVKNFDKESLWKWFVTSWRTPSAQQQGEKWYGIATLLVEILLFSIGFTHGLKATVMPSVSGGLFSFTGLQSKADNAMSGLGIIVFIALVVLSFGIITASYFSSKFVHGKTVEFTSYVNKVVQLSNLSAILVLAISILMFINFSGTAGLSILLMVFTTMLFLFAAGAEVLDGPKTKRDTFNGVILYIILVLILILIVIGIFGQQISSQIPSMPNF